MFITKRDAEEQAARIFQLETTVFRAEIQNGRDSKKIAELEHELQLYRNGKSVKYDSGNAVLMMNLFIIEVRKALTAFDTGKLTADHTLLLFKKYMTDLLDVEWYLSGKAFEEINRDIQKMNEMLAKMTARNASGRR